MPAIIINKISKSNTVNVLDFGGGTGFSYFPIKNYITHSHDLNWLVFDDNKKLYAVGKDHVKKRENLGLIDNIQFLNSMPNMKVDIIHSASTIEYIEDDEGLLEILAKKYSPQYFFLTRIKGGNMPDFITKQTVRGYSTPCRFSSVPRLINFFEKIGYRVILNSPCGSFVSDNFNHDIPLELQIRRGVDLILEKN